jgi:hypothetical protein
MYDLNGPIFGLHLKRFKVYAAMVLSISAFPVIDFSRLAVNFTNRSNEDGTQGHSFG